MNLPLFLTLIRLIGSITILPFFLITDNYKHIAAFLFLLLAGTDFLDGYYARAYNMETKLGKMLDPIADKFLITTTILCLISTKQCPLIFAIPLIMREIAILSIRQYAAEHNFILEVSKGGKIKTLFQCIALFVAIITPNTSVVLVYIRNIFLFLATLFSVSSLVNYCQLMNKKIKE